MSEQASAIGLGRAPVTLKGRHQGGRIVLGTALFVVLALAGRLTVLEDRALALVWPVSGLVVLFLWLGPVRRWPPLLAGLTLGFLAVNLLDGVPAAEAVLFTVSNLVQAVAGALALRAWAPYLLDVPTRALQQLRDFVVVALACVTASLLAAVVGFLGLALLEGDWHWADLFVWWGGSSAGSVVVVSCGVLVLGALREERRPADGSSAPASARRPVQPGRLVEFALLTAVTAAIYLTVFDWYASLPVAFPLLVPTVWAGLRFSPLVAALHSVVVSVLVVGFTVHGDGPFATVGSWEQEALVAQVFVLLVFGLGMLLAVGRSERLTLTRTLSSERSESHGQALMLTAVIDAMTDGLTLVDGSGRLIMRNAAGASLAHDRGGNTDVSQYVMVDSSGRELTHEELPQIRVFASQEEVITQDVVLRFEDGSPRRTLSISARRLPSADGGVSDRAVLVYHDVTAERAQRSALESFAGVVAHDLLGPLSVVDGWAEMLSIELEDNRELTHDRAAPQLARIRAASLSMRQLIEDLLTSSTSRHQELRPTDLDLDELTRAVASERREMTGGPVPVIDIGPLPSVHADEAMVRQLLNNLIGNAIKYVVPGTAAEISVHARHLGDRVEVTVADRGIGIPVEEREGVFDAFHRAHPDDRYEGHGIGLAVCKDVVERHGGHISVLPALDGRGTRMVFTLPAA